MTTADLSLVTQTLLRLVDLNVRNLLVRQGLAPDITVTAMSPEKIDTVSDTVNLHLYHVMEDANQRNLPPPGRGGAPVTRQPLSLLLYYILTAHHEANVTYDAETQQRLLGLAMKVLHDHPVIDDGLTVTLDGGSPQIVMLEGLRGRGNRMEISQRPLTPEESMAFWSAEQSSTTRLSAYYEVRTIFLEPEEPTGAHATVFDLGLFVAAGRAPVLEAVSGPMVFTPPPETGLPEQRVETSPARVTLAPGATPELGRIHLRGRGLSDGDTPGTARILLRTPAWRERVPALRSVPIAPGANADWQVELTEDSAAFTLRTVLAIDDGAGVSEDVAIVPGIYTVSVELTRRQQTPSGVERVTTSESNQLVFAVGARLADHDPADADGRILVRIVPTFDLGAPELDVALTVDGVRHDEVADFTGNAAVDAGSFRRQADGFVLHPLFDPGVAGAHPIRLVVDGAESQPFWVLTP